MDQTNICGSVRSSEEPHSKCLLRAKKGQRYCPLHLSQKTIIDFAMDEGDDEVETIKVVKTHPLTKTICLDTEPKGVVAPPTSAACIQKKSSSTDTLSKSNATMVEQKESTVEKFCQENDEELEIKLLILANDEEYIGKIGELIGPVFLDPTLSEDDTDPVTMDPIWVLDGRCRVPASINKYCLFSYLDSKSKIRCFTIFTMYNMIQNNDYVHPRSLEPIPPKDILRAKELVNIYSTKIGLFKKRNDLSPEFTLRNRIGELFKRFEIHSIYFEDKWLMDIDTMAKLDKIIDETQKFVSGNISSINPTLHKLDLFKRNYKRKKGTVDLLASKKYIVDEWEKLINASSSPQNQIPIWILACGLCSVVPEIKVKYPNLEIMI